MSRYSSCAAAWVAIALTVSFIGKATRTDAQVLVQIDPAAKTMRLASSSESRRVADSLAGGTFRFRRPAKVKMQVINTNTALYTMTTEDAPSPAPPVLGAIRQFVPYIKPYLPELDYAVPRSRGDNAKRTLLPASVPATVSVAASRAAAAALEIGQEVEGNLRDLDAAVHGPRGIDGTLNLSLRTLDRMRHGQVEVQADAMADSLGLPKQSCPARKTAENARDSSSFNLSANLLELLETLHSSAASLAVSLSDPALQNDPSAFSVVRPLQQLHARADTALHDSDGLVTSAYHVQEMARVVMEACSHWESPAVNVTTAAGRIVTVTIQPRTEPELQRVAEKAGHSFKVTLLPPLSRMDATVGASALMIPRALFHKYGVRATGGSSSVNEVYQADPVDSRFSYGITLGFTWSPWLDWRNSHRMAVWLPEITVAESGAGPKTFAVGTAVSFGSIKLGFGGAVIHHLELDGLAVGDRVPNDKFLKTRETYGHPLPYFSVTVFNLMDLLSGSRGGEPTETAKPKK